MFNSALVLLEYEPSSAQKQNLMRVWKGTFKQFMMIRKCVPDDLVYQMINCDLEEIAQMLVDECKIQWEQRKRFEEVEPKRRLKKRSNLMRCVPNQWCEIVNFQSSLCTNCADQVSSSEHLKRYHGITIKDVKDIWREDICPITNKNQGTPRARLRPRIEMIIRFYLGEIEEAKSKLMINRIGKTCSEEVKEN